MAAWDEMESEREKEDFDQAAKMIMDKLPEMTVGIFKAALSVLNDDKLMSGFTKRVAKWSKTQLEQYINEGFSREEAFELLSKSQIGLGSFSSLKK